MSKKFLITVASLIGCWPAYAQDFAAAPNASIAPLASSPITVAAPVSGATVPPIHLDMRHAPAIATQEFTIVSNRMGQSRASAVDSMYDLMETPFASSVRFPMASIAGGRLQLAGYHSLVSSENFQMGLPGGGTLPAWGIGQQSHPVVNVPQNNESGGFNVTFYLRGNEPGPLHLRPVHAVNRAVMFIRGI